MQWPRCKPTTRWPFTEFIIIRLRQWLLRLFILSTLRKAESPVKMEASNQFRSSSRLERSCMDRVFNKPIRMYRSSYGPLLCIQIIVQSSWNTLYLNMRTITKGSFSFISDNFVFHLKKKNLEPYFIRYLNKSHNEKQFKPLQYVQLSGGGL